MGLSLQITRRTNTAGNPGVRKCFSQQPRRIFLSTLGATLVARRRVNNSGKVLARAYVAKVPIWLLRAASVAVGADAEDAGEGLAGVGLFCAGDELGRALGYD